jgi:Flp pilus assembly protein TadB
VPEQESEYEKEVQWRKDACRFLAAIWKYWQWWIYISLGSSVALIVSWRGVVIPAWQLVIISLVGLVIATFKAWREERRRAERAEAALARFLADANSAPQQQERDWLRYGRHGKEPPRK